MYIHKHIYLCIYIHTCIYIYVCVFVCVYVRVCVCERLCKNCNSYSFYSAFISFFARRKRILTTLPITGGC